MVIQVDSCVSTLLRSGTHQSTSDCQLLDQEQGQQECDGSTIDSVRFSLAEMSFIECNAIEENSKSNNSNSQSNSNSNSVTGNDGTSSRSNKNSSIMGNYLDREIVCDQTIHSNFNNLHDCDEILKTARIPDLFPVGSSNIYIGVQPLPHERGSGSQNSRNEIVNDDRVKEVKTKRKDDGFLSMARRKEEELKGYSATIQSFIAAHKSLQTSLRAVIIFRGSSSSASIIKSNEGKEPMERTGVLDVPTVGVVEDFIFERCSTSTASCPSTPTYSLSPSSLSIQQSNLFEFPPLDPPIITSLVSNDIHEFSASVPDPGPGPDPDSIPLSNPIPTYDSIPGLILKAGLSKKDSSGEIRSLWCETIIPACLAFYGTHCLVDVNQSQMPLCPTSAMCNGSILIICEDGILSCTAVMAILLSHYRTTFEFDTLLSNPQSLCPQVVLSAADAHRVIQNEKETSSDSPLPLPLLSPSVPLCLSPVSHTIRLSKGDIRACLSVLQMYLPMADQIPRRLVKELNMFFSSFRASR